LALGGAVDREDVATRGAGRIGVRDVRCLSVEFQLANARSADAPALRERFADRRGV
jgi:hypothetical protein